MPNFTREQYMNKLNDIIRTQSQNYWRVNQERKKIINKNKEEEENWKVTCNMLIGNVGAAAGSGAGKPFDYVTL